MKIIDILKKLLYSLIKMFSGNKKPQNIANLESEAKELKSKVKDNDKALEEIKGSADGMSKEEIKQYWDKENDNE